MFRHRLITRTVASVIAGAALGGALVLSPATAGATPQDEQFTDIVSQLGIPVDSPEQAVKLGNDICTLMTQGRAQTVDPVPAVRGVVRALTAQGLERGQAVTAMRAAVSIYCPEYGPLVGR